MVKLSTPRPVKAKIADVTASRDLDVTYQNTTGRPLLCLVSVALDRASAVGAGATAQGLVATVSPPNVVAAQCSLAPLDNNRESAVFCLPFMVPTYYYFKVAAIKNTGGDNVIKIKWIEVEL